MDFHFRTKTERSIKFNAGNISIPIFNMVRFNCWICRCTFNWGANSHTSCSTHLIFFQKICKVFTWFKRANSILCKNRLILHILLETVSL